MLGSDSSKRQRTDDQPSTATTPSSASPLSISSKSDQPSSDSKSRLRTRDLLHQMLATQQRLSADVARLQSTVDAVLSTLHFSQPTSQSTHPDTLRSLVRHNHSRPPPLNAQSRTGSEEAITDAGGISSTGAVLPTLANIVGPRSRLPQNTSLSDSETDRKPVKTEDGEPKEVAKDTSEASSSPHQHRQNRDSATDSNSSRHWNHPQSSQIYQPEQGQQSRSRNPARLFYSTTPPPPLNKNSMQSSSSSGSIASAALGNLPPPAFVPRNSSSGTLATRLRSPPIAHQQHQQYHHSGRHYQPSQHGMLLPPPTTPLSAPPMSSPFSSSRFPHHSQYQHQQTLKASARLPHQTHQQHYNALPASTSPRRLHPHAGTEQAISLPPIRTSSAAAFQQPGHHRGSVPPKPSSVGPSTYSPASAFASGMVIDATPTSAKPSSPQPQQQVYMPGYGYSRVPPSIATAASTPTSAMMESPTASSAGFASSGRGQFLPSHPMSAGVSGGSSSKGLPGSDSIQQKVEKNRFQANIRAFVDQHFSAEHNAQWDYQQSFKAPRNAQATQQIVQAFHSEHGGTYDRIEHGLSVYFSSLKAKHRTTEDKAMLKQQRDRRRARRIKKAAGRRKVFDQSQFPFLPREFEAQTCFVPSAMSPEHTDDDGEVKVGLLPWRADTFTRLFRHLDSLRPKRTPRPNNSQLSGGQVPPPDMPAFMIDPDYLAIDRSQHEQHEPEEDIEMESYSDGE
ncbi:hypothetical protein H4R99_007726 [Coemansia sp. RSA 1722]|nr:hypothetical protein H4R99_007726 [Coemansia sp. RSA 1722]KAJ2601565.1 hypothetical protein GGF39_001206 [Coemansia sp. RSA 1721]KAJ2639351.1 hypothetical protein GGF40_000909 [Coemansia sp. RSA 1286]